MLFSVVVPIWKRPKELELLLDSLNNQAQQHEILIEVILSDSNSGLEIDKVISKAIVENKNLKIKIYWKPGKRNLSKEILQD